MGVRMWQDPTCSSGPWQPPQTQGDCRSLLLPETSQDPGPPLHCPPKRGTPRASMGHPARGGGSDSRRRGRFSPLRGPCPVTHLLHAPTVLPGATQRGCRLWGHQTAKRTSHLRSTVCVQDTRMSQPSPRPGGVQPIRRAKIQVTEEVVTQKAA